MAARLNKGPGINRVTFVDGPDEVVIPVTPRKIAEGTFEYDVMLGDARTMKGDPVPMILMQKIKRTLAEQPSPLDGKLVVR